MSDWKPIESCPADEYVLLCGYMDGPHDPRVKMGYYFSETKQFVLDGASWKPKWWMPAPKGPKDTPKKIAALTHMLRAYEKIAGEEGDLGVWASYQEVLERLDEADGFEKALIEIYCLQGSPGAADASMRQIAKETLYG